MHDQLYLGAVVDPPPADVSNKLMFIDKASGAKSERPGLDSCMQELQAGDTLVIWRIIFSEKWGLLIAKNCIILSRIDRM